MNKYATTDVCSLRPISVQIGKDINEGEISQECLKKLGTRERFTLSCSPTVPKRGKGSSFWTKLYLKKLGTRASKSVTYI